MAIEAAYFIAKVELFKLSCNLSTWWTSAKYYLCGWDLGLFLYLNNGLKQTRELSNVNGTPGSNQRHFPAADLKIAIKQSLSILGGNLSEAIILELGRKGIDLNSSTASYSLREVESILEGFLGESASALVMDRIKEHLQLV